MPGLTTLGSKLSPSHLVLGQHCLMRCATDLAGAGPDQVHLQSRAGLMMQCLCHVGHMSGQSKDPTSEIRSANAMATVQGCNVRASKASHG